MATRKAAEVTTEAAASRNRAERPCDACRRRKSRCVVQEASRTCLQCEATKQSCTFVENPRSRKRLSTSDDGSSENPRKRRSPETQSFPKPAVQNNVKSYPSRAEWLSNQSHGYGSKSGSTVAPMTYDSDRNVQYIGPTTEIETGLLNLSPLDHHGESSLLRGRVRKVSDTDMLLMMPETADSLEDDPTEALIDIETIVGSSGVSLVDLYFEFVDPNFPILQQGRFLDEYNNTPSAIAVPLLAAVYILAMNWPAQDAKLRAWLDVERDDLIKVALKSLEAAMSRPDLSTIQAGLLLLQRPGGESWPLTSQLLSVGQELGLHLDCSGWRIPEVEKGLRKRLAWALFMQDKWGSLIHGRPSHIAQPNWLVGPLTGEDFDKGTGPHQGREGFVTDDEVASLLFMQMVSLTGILSDILDALYSLQALQEVESAGKQGTKLILERAKPIQMKLKDWFTRLPGGLRLDKPSARVSSVGYLHLAYFATEITLHRRIISSLNLASTDAYLSHICRSAAKTRLISAMDFVNRLKPEHLQSFWYFPSRVNFALIGTFGSLLWATAPSKEEADFYRLRLGEYKWTLNVSNKTAGFMGFAVDHLDSCSHLLKGLKKPSISAMKRQGDRKTEALNLPDAPPFLSLQDLGHLEHLDSSTASDLNQTASGPVSPSSSTSNESDGLRAAVPAETWSSGFTHDGQLSSHGRRGRPAHSQELGSNSSMVWQ